MANMTENQQSGLTVSQLEDTFYIKKLIVKVVKVANPVNSLPGPSQNIRMALADGTGWIRSKMPSSMENKLQEKACFTLKKFSVRDGTLHISNSTAIYRAALFDVPSNVIEAASLGFMEPVHPVVDIMTALASPPKKKMSVRGRIIANHAVRDVNVRGIPTPVRDIDLEDGSGKIKATLWRTATEVDLRAGDKVTLKDVVTHYSTYNKQMTLSVNDINSLEVIVEEKEISMKIIGVADEEIQATLTLLCEVDEEDLELLISFEILVGFIGVSPTSLEELLEHLPITCLAEVKRDKL